MRDKAGMIKQELPVFAYWNWVAEVAARSMGKTEKGEKNEENYGNADYIGSGKHVVRRPDRL